MEKLGNYVDYYLENDEEAYDQDHIDSLIQEKRSAPSNELIEELQMYAVPDGFLQAADLGALLKVLRERMTD